jgi:hypothetical protein
MQKELFHLTSVAVQDDYFPASVSNLRNSILRNFTLSGSGCFLSFGDEIKNLVFEFDTTFSELPPISSK